MEYEVYGDGIYAILFTPDLEDAIFREEVYCGILCKDKRLVFIFTLVIFPMIILLIYVAYKV